MAALVVEAAVADNTVVRNSFEMGRFLVQQRAQTRNALRKQANKCVLPEKTRFHAVLGHSATDCCYQVGSECLKTFSERASGIAPAVQLRAE